MIKDLLICFHKEFRCYFQNKMIYLVLFVYEAMSAGLVFFGSDLYSNTSENMAQFFIYQSGILATIIPVLTMRLWADEYKHNTLEVILTAPVELWAIVAGKFLAVWAVSGVMILASVVVFAVVALIVPLDVSWVAINYAVTFLMAGGLCALAAMAAAFCYNTIAAFLAGMGLCMLVVMANFESWVSQMLPDSLILGDVAKACDFRWQFENMIMGQIGVPSLVYFAVLIAAALWMSLIAVEYKRR